MSVQSSVSTQAQLAVAGQVDSSFTPLNIVSRIAATAVSPGLLACFTAGASTIRHLAADAADVDAFKTNLASSASAQTISGAGLNGVVGTGIMRQARNVTITLSSSADWDATEVTVFGLDAFGSPTADTLEIPNGGNATVAGLALFSAITSVQVPAQSGTGGTGTIGFGDLLGPLDGAAAGIVAFDSSRSALAFAAAEAVPVVRGGRVWVSSETAAAIGGVVFVRQVAGAGESVGAIRATPDANDCALLPGARFASSTAAAGLVLVELNLP
jgi:hypothetical protein